MLSRQIWLTLTIMLAVVFAVLGALFVLAPEPASAIFGVPLGSHADSTYVRALGIRDLALCGFIVVLAPVSVPALRRLLAASALIPLGDIVLVLLTGEPGAPLPLMLHAASAAVLVGLVITAPKDLPPSVPEAQS